MHGLEQELRSHAGALRALALRLVGPAHAEDLVQETSLLAWTQRPDERGGLGAWLRLCPHCGGRRRLLTAIQDPAAIRQVLAAMGLSAAVPELAAARSPPGESGIGFSG